MSELEEMKSRHANGGQHVHNLAQMNNMALVAMLNGGGPHLSHSHSQVIHEHLHNPFGGEQHQDHHPSGHDLWRNRGRVRHILVPDIDNMSYDELCAWEQKQGHVESLKSHI